MTLRNSLGPIIALLLPIACESPRTAGETASAASAATREAAGRDSAARAVADTLWLFASSPADDAVHATDTEATLRARYGANNLASERIHLGEARPLRARCSSRTIRRAA